MRRGLATGIVGLALFVATVAFLAVFGSLFFTQISELIKGLPTYVEEAVTWVNSTFHLDLDPSKILDNLQITPAKVAEWGSSVAGGVFGIVGSIFGALFDGLTVFVFAFYFSADGPRLRRAIGSWLPLRSQKVFVTVWDIAVNKTGGFVVSKVVLATISAFFHCSFFALIGVRTGCRWASSPVSSARFIPTIGTYIA